MLEYWKNGLGTVQYSIIPRSRLIQMLLQGPKFHTALKSRDVCKQVMVKKENSMKATVS